MKGEIRENDSIEYLPFIVSSNVHHKLNQFVRLRRQREKNLRVNSRIDFTTTRNLM